MVPDIPQKLETKKQARLDDDPCLIGIRQTTASIVGVMPRMSTLVVLYVHGTKPTLRKKVQ